jgi:hypothetical protein
MLKIPSLLNNLPPVNGRNRAVSTREAEILEIQE